MDEIGSATGGSQRRPLGFILAASFLEHIWVEIIEPGQGLRDNFK
jgi:hypothetical protein